MDFSHSDTDFDFDLENDRVNRFLLNKLEEIRAKNEKLSVTLHERRQLLCAVTESSNTEMDEVDLKISPKPWKKIFNNKYILGITVENTGARCLHNPKVILKWDSSDSLLYRVFMYEEISVPSVKTLTSPTFICSNENCSGITNSLKKSDKVNKSAHLVVTLELPKFINELSYNITGNIIFQQDDRKVTLTFPPVELSAYDATTHSLHNSSLFNGDVSDILMTVSSSEETNLVMILPQDWSNSFDSTLEILCSLTKVNTMSKCRKLFFAHKLSPLFDDSLLMFHAPTKLNNIYNFTIYSRNEDSLICLLHHLHQNIPGVLIIPDELYENYIQQHPELISIERESSELMECLKKEINYVENFLGESQNKRDVDKVEFYRKFADVQLDTNTRYIRLLRAACQFPD